jgi:uncharacterized protein (TIGR03086 family)
MDTLKLLQRTFESTGHILEGVGPDELSNPTPCSEWDVRALLDHVIGVIAGFGAAAARESAPPAPPEVGDEPLAAYRTVTQQALDAWNRPGALEGTCTIGHGLTVPAGVAAGINVLDTLVHGWDLARATGQDETLDPELAAAALEIARQVVSDEIRGSGSFDAPVAVSAAASPTAELVAFLGRRP